jgi:hypothetical protein
MRNLFSLDAHTCGNEHHATADSDGFGIVVRVDGVPRRARTYSDAVRLARDHIGRILEPAEQGGIPWGLRVTVPDGAAVYGEWPLVGRSGSQSFERTPLARIRSRWRESRPLSALDNAVEILRAYTSTSVRHAA